MTINLLDPNHYQDSRIKFIDLHPDKELKEKLDYAYSCVMASGRYIGGEEVEAFEEEWASYIGAKHCVACGNGFDALVLAMKAIGIRNGCEVSVPSFTCLPTWAAVEATGATVKPIDDLEKLFEYYTDAVIPVHLYGNPCFITYTQTATIIEDACQAHGSLYPDGTKIGSKNLTAWSFYPTKNLGCYGDGGAITTNDNLIASYVREMRNYGGNHFRSGINSRLDSLQAAFLRVKLPYLDKWNARRTAIAKKYIDGMQLISSCSYYGTPNWHQFTLTIDNRDDLRKHLYFNGIETMIHYETPPHRHRSFSAYKDYCPKADEWSKTTLSLPIAPHLTDEQVEYIISKVNEWIEKCQSK